jgi:hypothetical protein
MYWFIGITAAVIALIILINWVLRKERREYLLKWEVDDLVRVKPDSIDMWFRDLLEAIKKANQTYSGYSAAVVKIKKWETAESLVELANGDSYFIPTRWIGENIYCDRRLKHAKMDTFMKERNSTKQDKRDESLNELLESKTKNND